MGYRVPFQKLCSTRVQNCNLGTGTVFDFNIILDLLKMTIKLSSINKNDTNYSDINRGCPISEAVSKLEMHVSPCCPRVLLLRCYFSFFCLLKLESQALNHIRMCVYIWTLGFHLYFILFWIFSGPTDATPLLSEMLENQTTNLLFTIVHTCTQQSVLKI